MYNTFIKLLLASSLLFVQISFPSTSSIKLTGLDIYATSSHEPDETELLYDAGIPKESEIPNETYLTIGIALLASSFAFKGCIKPPSFEKIPLITFVTMALAFLFREVRIKEEFEERSRKLFQIKKWEGVEDATRQVEVFRTAAEQERLAAKASEDKAGNAKFLENTLLFSAALIGGFLFIKCKLNPLCFKQHNSCDGGEASSLRPMENITTPLLWDMLLPIRAHAVDVKKLGIASLSSLMGFTDTIGKRIADTPNIYKAIMLTTLSRVASRSHNKWQEISETFKKNAQNYENLARMIETQLKAKVTTSFDNTIIPPKNNNSSVPNTKGSVQEKISSHSHCATGDISSLSMDKFCQCHSDNSCTQANLPKVDFNAMKLPSLAGKTYNGLGREVDSLFNGNTWGGATGLSANPGRYSAIKQWHNRVFGKLKKAIKDNDFNKIKNRALKGTKSAILTTYYGMSPNHRSAFADLTGSFGPSNPHFFHEELEKTTKDLASKGVEITIPPSTLNPSQTGHDLFSSSPSPNTDDLANFENLDTAEANIVEDRQGVSLWKILTVRYLKTAFPLIFEEK